MKIRLVSFDLDGTLVDTAGEIAEAVHRAFDDLGIARRPQAEITRLIGRGTRELMLKLLARVMLEEPALAERVRPDAVLERFEHHYAETAGRFGQPYPGCVSTLERLRDLGVRLVCVTNKEQRHAERVLAATGLDGFFSMLIGGDTLPVKKPHTGVIAHVLRHQGVSANHAAHVGDSSIDIESARNAGVRAWAVPHGYNAGVPIEESHPDQLFQNLPAIADEVDALGLLQA
ncbi:HAD-IA family hydrolase [Methylibium sp.]|uniref:HAD-IA family hydrolase n=1 Tax=Methylibium sp. TaxID=2067992 RepID=UPI003D0F83C2